MHRYVTLGVGAGCTDNVREWAGVWGLLVVYPAGWDRPPANHSLPGGGLQGYGVRGERVRYAGERVYSS